MELIPRNPTEGVYPTGGDWVHAMEVRGAERFLFLSGTMGLDPAGAAGTDLDEQLVLVWDDIRSILAGAGMTTDNIVRLTCYQRDVPTRRPMPRRACARSATGGSRPRRSSSRRSRRNGWSSSKWWPAA